MDRDALLRKALFMLHKCRSEGVDPLGWGMSPELWTDLIASVPPSLWVKQDNSTPKLYGLPVEVDSVYTDLSIRII